MWYFSHISTIGRLTHWGRVTHICVSIVSITGSDNGLSPDRRQAIIWTNVGILLIRPLGTNFSEILIEIQIFSYKKMNLKMSSAKWWSFCLSLNVLMNSVVIIIWKYTPYSARQWSRFAPLFTLALCIALPVYDILHLFYQFHVLTFKSVICFLRWRKYITMFSIICFATSLAMNTSAFRLNTLLQMTFLYLVPFT